MMTRRNAAVLTALVASAVVGWASESQAATATLTESGITRKAALRAQAANPLWVSRDDCLADDVMSFPLSLTDYAGLPLEVWAGGTDCKDKTARQGTAPNCWLVWKGVPTANSLKVDIRVQDIVGQHKPPVTTAPGAGTAADCTPPAGTADLPVAVSLYFMFIDQGSNEQQGGVSWGTKYDLVGPDAPTELMAEAAGAVAKVTWKAPTSTDVAGFTFFREGLQQASDCTQSSFKEGDPAPSTAPAHQVSGVATSEATLPLPASGADSIVLVAVDSVGNTSVQANPVCLLPASAPPDGLQETSSEDSGCSASARSPREGGWLVALLGSALAAMVIRRKKH